MKETPLYLEKYLFYLLALLSLISGLISGQLQEFNTYALGFIILGKISNNPITIIRYGKEKENK